MGKNMKTTKRFEEAVRKLYTAFHNNTLDAMDCKHCAVGNLVGHRHWSTDLCEKKIVFFIIDNTSDYTAKELATIERLFLYGAQNRVLFTNEIANWEVEKGYKTKEEQKDLQFQGLCAVVEYLAELDGIDNPMDYSRLFETENNKPKYEFAI